MIANLHLPSSLSLTIPSPTKSRTVRTLSKTVSSRLSLRPSVLPISAGPRGCIAEIHSKSLNFVLSGALALGLFLGGIGLAEAKVGVNKPELLPKEFSTVIDVAGFLSDGQEKRLAQEIASLEKDTGFKLRVLAQNYPETPGNILNFNVGATVDLDIPRSFWSRLAGTYGNIFYWKEKGEDASIEAAVAAISSCLREPVGPNNCSEVK
ncbi:thylakoid lumenal 15.0 kDa protein 2, chloroplastic-like isoform X4 [Neltuma alba]|uniref:thylakoid lumenal 15.0 kDa protein 2, chloroplastic-like isoform X2 n=1 Tax=Neltuma alba TaxID=207710 RepID=UPI0010A4F101|nr:thylakoid lumenal 15.0 kDa protein 2, chloroplastic-like isoform X2 [Prosopis alba]XP_028796967.1 thylakoid lumenal 15.0 kDa protein 2, chloroplastic-like isoform X4 [Prosopis alba]